MSFEKELESNRERLREAREALEEFLADKHRSFGFDAAVSAQGLSDFRDKVEAARRDTASVRRLVAAGLEIRMGHCRSFTEKFVQGVRRAAGLPPTGQLDDAVQDEVEAAMYRVEEDALAAHPHVQAAVERENAAWEAHKAASIEHRAKYGQFEALSSHVRTCERILAEFERMAREDAVPRAPDPQYEARKESFRKLRELRDGKLKVWW